MLCHVENDELVQIHVSKHNRVELGSSSKGNQIKWVKDGYYIKLNTWKWYEDISEVLVSYLLGFSSVENYVKYYPCAVFEDGSYIGVGCYCKSFLSDGWSNISLYRILKSSGIGIESMNYDTVRDSVYDITRLDIKPYLDVCLCIDAICCNEDRHLNNLSILKCGNSYKYAPVFDNGLACLSDIFSYPFEKSLVENIRSVYSKPFYSDFRRQLIECRVTPININIDSFMSSVTVKTKEECRALEVIKYGLKEYKGLAWEEY